MYNKTSGSILAYVIILMTAAAIIILATLQQSSVVLGQVQARYYNKLAEEAAEAGAVYASACLESNDKRQTWGQNYAGGGGATRLNLAPQLDCQGSLISGASKFVLTNTKVQTKFDDPRLEPGSQPNSALISSTGYAEVLSG